MIQPITLMGAGLCLGALALRYWIQPKDAPKKRSAERIRANTKILLAAVLAWMTVGYALQHLNRSLDGQHEQEESTVERAVHFIAKLL